MLKFNIFNYLYFCKNINIREHRFIIEMFFNTNM